MEGFTEIRPRSKNSSDNAVTYYANSGIFISVKAGRYTLHLYYQHAEDPEHLWKFSLNVVTRSNWEQSQPNLLLMAQDGSKLPSLGLLSACRVEDNTGHAHTNFHII